MVRQRVFDHPASIRAYVADVNKFLSSIRPIESIPRMPRNLDDVAYWKVSEMKAFLLIYSLPILKNIMPDVYFKHQILLVYAMRILNSPSISPDKLTKADNAYKNMLNGLKFCTDKKT